MNWREKVLDFNIANRGEGLTGLVFDVQKFATHDGGGIRTNVFLKGCPLQCLWCSNPESLSPQPESNFVPNNCIGCGKCRTVCPQDAIGDGKHDQSGLTIDRDRCTLCGECSKFCYAGAINILGRYVTVPELMEMVEKDREFYEESGGGITFSGGEPLAQPQFLKAALKEAQSRGIHTAIETSSFASWEVYEPILEYVDLVLADIKHMDDEEHKKVTGVSNRLILENIRKVSDLGIPLRIRLPLIPGINDSDSNLNAVADFVQQLNNVQSLDILPYHRLGEMKWRQLDFSYPLEGLEPPTLEQVKERISCLQDRSFKVSIGG
ncbi:pyruvate formate lyase-activating protein [Syntrophotalea acetylenivorans]|uniref:Pyruvate formate lyase-activating protein n=1 Tax=Syntrophotalea acetylenivorans TaxID=1842532 RepID=A0A1L3GPA0_9BACT|nr:glycyl-radical enzyme activating protein [Syntrophotalea acetylenivorans]APG27498.1 pyruvate formate lyase-activating protein [Syntrophotalea acetylenivorans]